MPLVVREVVVAIDVGSTETRIVYVWRDEHGKIHRVIIENRRDHRKKLGYNGFSSRILVHDGGEGYIGNLTQVGEGCREESSAKYAPYVLVEKLEHFMIQHPILKRLMDERRRVGKPILYARLEKAFGQLLRFVFEALKRNLALSSTEEVKMQVSTLVLTIPTQWNMNFQDLYTRLFLEALGAVFADRPDLAASDPDVQFVTEADALANYTMLEALEHHRLGLGLPTMDEILSKTNAQLFIDCGGHNANSTLTSFSRKSDGSGAMCQLASPQGAGGGCEMMCHDVTEQAIAQYRDETGDQNPLPGSLRHHLKLQTADALKHSMGYATFDHRPDVCSIKITEEMEKKGFEAGFKYVKDMIKHQLQELVRIKSGWNTPADQQIASTIVSGGSSLHPYFWEWITETCENLGLDEPHSTLNMENMYGAVRIATGAAYASLTAGTVESFSQKCAFGIKQGNVMLGNDGEHVIWEETARTIWHNQQAVPDVELVGTGRLVEYCITCQPSLETSTDRLQSDSSGAKGSSYVFLNFASIPDFHKYKVEFNFKVQEKQVEIKLHQIPLSTGRNAARLGGTIILGPYPVYIEIGTGNLLIELDDDELKRQMVESFSPFEHKVYRSTDEEDLPDAPEDDENVEGPPNNQPPADDETPAGFEDPVNDEDSADADYRPGAADAPRGNRRQGAGNASIGGANYDGGHDRPQTPQAPVGTAANDAAGSISDDDDDEPLILRAPMRRLAREQALDDSTDEAEGHSDGHDGLMTLAEAAYRASRSETTASTATTNVSDAPANGSSSGRGTYPSKAETARATESAFRPRNDVYRRASPDSRTGSGGPGDSRRATSDTAPGQVVRNPLSSTPSFSWTPPAGSFAGPPPMAADTQRGEPTGRKRPALGTFDDARPQKRALTSGGGRSSSTNSAPRQTAARPSAPPQEPIWRGTAFQGRARATGPSSSPVAPATRDNDASSAQQSEHIPYHDMRAPSRRAAAAAAAQSTPFSDRRRENGSGAAAGHTARRTPQNNVLLSGNGPTPIRGQTREGNAAMRRSFSGLSIGAGDDRTPARGGSVSRSESEAAGRGTYGPDPSGSTLNRAPRTAAEFYAWRELDRQTSARGGRGGGGGRGDSRGSQRYEPYPARNSGGPAESSRNQSRGSGIFGFRPANRGRGPRTSD